MCQVPTIIYEPAGKGQREDRGKPTVMYMKLIESIGQKTMYGSTWTLSSYLVGEEGFESRGRKSSTGRPQAAATEGGEWFCHGSSVSVRMEELLITMSRTTGQHYRKHTPSTGPASILPLDLTTNIVLHLSGFQPPQS